jgi:amidase
MCDGTRVASSDEDLIFRGPGTLAAMVRSGEVHPKELVEACLRRIEELNPRLNAFRTTLAEEALAAADAAASSDGPLAGVPIAIKDDTAVAGHEMTRGSRSYAGPEPADAEVVRKLRAAGAIPIGISNVPELMIWPWTASDANGITRNPWDLSRTTGGSSGGSGAAVAAGLVAAATGSDGGGSIRIPAACCGLVGIKATRGRVSTQPEAEHWLGLSTFGPLARTVADSALLLDVMQGSVAGDLDRAPTFTGSYRDAATASPGRLRIAVSRKIPSGLIAPVSPDQRGAWEQTGTLLSELGHDVVERDPAYGQVAFHFVQCWLRGVYEDAFNVPEPDKLEPLTRQAVEIGKRVVPDWRVERLRLARGKAIARVTSLWDEVDVVVTPALASTAIEAEAGYGRSFASAFNLAGRFTPWTSPFNVTGQPALTLPAGMGSDGLPLSVQLVGRHGAEDVLYSLAAQIEQARPWADQRPPVQVGPTAVTT